MRDGSDGVRGPQRRRLDRARRLIREGAPAYGAPATAADAVRVLASCVLCRAWALAEGLRPVVPIFPAIAFLIPLWMYAKIALALGMAGAEADTVRRRAVGAVIHGAAPLYALLFIHGDATRLRAEQSSCVPIDLAVVSLSLLVLGQVKNTITFGDFLATRVALVSVLGEAYGRSVFLVHAGVERGAHARLLPQRAPGGRRAATGSATRSTRACRAP